MRPASMRSLAIHVILYAAGFGALAKVLPWAAFAPVAIVVSLVHLYLTEWAKRRRVRLRSRPVCQTRRRLSPSIRSAVRG